MLTRVIDVGLVLLFVVMALLQLNDPDPARWVAIYGAVAIIAGFAGFARFSVPAIVVAFAICLVWSLSLMPAVFELFVSHDPGELTGRMDADKPYVEQARESLGLLAATAALAYLFVSARRARKSAAPGDARDP